MSDSKSRCPFCGAVVTKPPAISAALRCGSCLRLFAAEPPPLACPRWKPTESGCVSTVPSGAPNQNVSPLRYSGERERAYSRLRVSKKCTRERVLARMPLCVQICVCVHQCARVCAYMHVRARVYLRVHVDAYACVYVCT